MRHRSRGIRCSGCNTKDPRRTYKREEKGSLEPQSSHQSLTSKVGPASFLVPLIALVNETSGKDASVFRGSGKIWKTARSNDGADGRRRDDHKGLRRPAAAHPVGGRRSTTPPLRERRPKFQSSLSALLIPHLHTSKIKRRIRGRNQRRRRSISS